MEPDRCLAGNQVAQQQAALKRSVAQDTRWQNAAEVIDNWAQKLTV